LIFCYAFFNLDTILMENNHDSIWRLYADNITYLFIT
jgi:hypothetical protein